MKKTILYAAAFVAAVASCNKPEIDAPVAEEKVWVEFTTGAMTKVTREDVEGDADIKHKFVWEENDAITVNGETFTTTESGDKVTFGAEVPVSFLDATSFEAIYPASAGESFEAITVPATYEAVPESGFYGIVAVAASENQSFQFKHATSFVKFQVPTAVSNVTISADEDLAGVVSVAMTDGAAVVTVKEGKNTVTLSGSFVAGKDYYVPVLAGTKPNLTVKFDGNISKTWASATLNQGRVANMGALPQPKVERGLNFSSSTATATYGQSFTVPTLSGVTDGVTYTSSNTSVATVDASTGKVTLVAGGTTTITASAPENNTHLAGSASFTLTVKQYVYLVPNINWCDSNARFAAYFYADGKTEKWVDMTKEANVYKCEVEEGYTNVIFCRMNGSNKENNWENKWNQTADLNVPSDNKLYYFIKGWGDNSKWDTQAFCQTYFAASGKLYLVPTASWKQGNERYAAYFYENGKTEKWIDLSSTTAFSYFNGAYEVTPPSGYTNIIFCRMNGSNKENNWSNKWDQTADLKVSGGNLYEMPTNKWSTISYN